MERKGEWDQLHDEAMKKLAAWRQAHPKATLAEIEREVDDRMATLRARLIQDVALASAAADVKGQAQRLPCPHCDRPVRVEGQRKRRLKSEHMREIDLQRDYVICPHCHLGFFPPR